MVALANGFFVRLGALECEKPRDTMAWGFERYHEAFRDRVALICLICFASILGLLPEYSLMISAQS